MAGTTRKTRRNYLQWMVSMLSFWTGVSLFYFIHHHANEDGSSSTDHLFQMMMMMSPPTSIISSLPCTSSTQPSQNQRLPHNTNTKATTTKTNKKKFAYAFLMAGCDPESSLTYRPYLWNILVAAENLVASSSSQTTADIVVMVQFQRNTTTTILPSTDVQWLELYPNIHIHYLPTEPLRDNFYNAQLAKFHILELIQYDQVMYLDADVMPLCSMDYIFFLQAQQHQQLLLQPNIILAWFTEPAHGGWFVLQPYPGAYEELLKIIERREQEALQLPYPHWDSVLGWGHALSEEWYGLNQPVEILDTTDNHNDKEPKPDRHLHRYGPPRHSTNWTFHGDFADQGLLYYWTRFHRKQVSILYLDYLLEYDNTNHSPKNVSTDFLQPMSCLPPGKERLGQYGSTLQAPLFYDKVPHRDFVHFSGTNKPWETKRTSFPSNLDDRLQSSTDYWYYQLSQVFAKYSQRYPNRKLPRLPLKFKAPSLGRYPTYRSMIGTIQKKERKKKQQQAATVEAAAAVAGI